MSDPVCKYPQLTEECKPKCTEALAAYSACAERIKGKKDGDCEAWLFDYTKCLDKCRAPQIMKHLK